MSPKAKGNDKWALILGASSGFGGATSVELAKAGFNICGVHFDRRSSMPAVNRVKSNIRSKGVKALFFNINAADEGKRDEALKVLKKETKGVRNPVKLLMHSLAFGSLMPFVADSKKDAITKRQVELTLDVMAHSLIYWTQDLVYRNLIGAGGQIVSMTSAGGHIGWPSYGAVSAAKASLESHTRQLAIELAKKKIAVNCIQAGVTDTPSLRKIPENASMIKKALSVNPSGRLTTPQDVAKLITMLALMNSNWVTGNIIRADGGEDITG